MDLKLSLCRGGEEMAVIQEAFVIPEDLVLKLATGEYKRIGGVVRHAIGPHKGEIVKFLEPVDLKTAKEAKGLVAKALQLILKHKTGAIVGATVTILVTAGGVIYMKVRNREPKVVKEFRSSLKSYIDAMRNGNMTLNDIDALSNALSNLKAYKNYEKFKIQLSSEELGALISRIFDYTERLAKMNDYSMDGMEATKNKETDATIINLENYLKRQREWFSAA